MLSTLFAELLLALFPLLCQIPDGAPCSSADSQQFQPAFSSVELVLCFAFHL